jgi:hypothetical protein
VAEPAAPQVKAAPDPEGADIGGDRAEAPAHLARQPVRHAFVGVENQDPGMLRRHVGERPIPLDTETFEAVLNEAHPALATYPLRMIGAERIDDDHVIAPVEAVEAAW